MALLAAFIPARASGQTTAVTPPRIFQSETNAAGADFYPDRSRGLTPVAAATHAQFGLGSSRIDATRGPFARAGILDPGAGVVKGPALACSELGGQAFSQFPEPFGGLFAPIIAACTQTAWPFIAESDSLTAADTSTAGAVTFGNPTSPLSGEGGGASAHLDDYDSSTDSSIGAMRLGAVPGGGPTGLPLPGAIPPPPGTDPADTTLVEIGSVRSTTRSFLDGSASVSQATSTVSGIRLFGGLVTIDSVTSTAEARSADGEDPVGTSNTVVQGLAVAGQPAEVGPDGVRAGEQATGGPDAANAAMASALEGAGLSIRLLDATQGTDESGAMTATAQGVLVDFRRPLSLPNGLSDEYFAALQLASVSSRALAYEIRVTPQPIAAPSGSSPLPAFTPTAAPAPVSGSTGGTTVGAAPAPPAAAGGAAATEAPSTSRTGLVIDPGKIRFLYLSFTLAALGLCLAPKLTVPARLPGLGGRS